MNTDQVTLLAEWEQARGQLTIAKSLVEKEMELRKKVVAMFFPNPKEGTNNAELAQGWKLKYAHQLDYKLDEAAIPAIREQLAAASFSPDKVFAYSPKLILAEYRLLGDNIKPIVDAALTIKPKSPTLELVPPKPKG